MELSEPKENIETHNIDSRNEAPSLHIASSNFTSLPIRRLNAQSLSPLPLPGVKMDMNPFNTMNIDIIPGPISLQCDNIQFIKSWVKYIFQSAISVTSHTITFLITILWIRYLFSSYYQYQQTHNKDTNDISKYTLSILSYLPFSSWIWIAICLSNIIFFLGFMIQCLIIPIQWNFEDNSNTKLLRYFIILFIFIVIMTNITFSILQIFSYSFSYDILIISEIIIVMLFALILLFVIIKKSRNSSQLSTESSSESSVSSSPSQVKNNNEIYQKIKIKIKSQIKTATIIAAIANNYSCSKLVLICILFSVIITLTIASFYINFRFVLSIILTNNTNKHIFFDQSFLSHLCITIFGTLLIGDLLLLFMRILMRWLTILLSDSHTKHSNSISWSYNAHYGSMQSFNKMILFAIPLMFIIKLSVFLMLYTFVDPVEFAVAVTAFCIFSRCFNKIFLIIEDNMLCKLISYYDDEYSITNLQDDHFLAQCNFLHDIIIHYIATLLIPLMFALFGVNFQYKYNPCLPHFHYLQTAVIQFLIQCIFDLFPLILILIVNPACASTVQGRASFASFYHFSQNITNINQQIKGSNCCRLSRLAMNLKVEYINMMNGWTATDKCVRHFMWWCTIFIGGYFAFYLLYPQQFLCAIHQDRHSIVLDNWIYIQCQ